MRNPLRSEAEAFRFLLITIAFFGAIVATRLLVGTLVALLVAIGGIAAIGWLLQGESKSRSRGRPAIRVVSDDQARESREGGDKPGAEDPSGAPHGRSSRTRSGP
ncbi:MAG: hypothetical protein ACXVY3_07180 [Gaiellaceae bacterium]